ncbi:hypothetical protein T12_2398 [Trichinella patagoniensis]|uniref:Uncharacterized protein n=1 Tax=Trichinella patagoniensis TaxID=990121 RepID=A0A0V0ZD06_9BILA|nr:hypothetical protein T12_2398 [Trichinella patagoniensis]
MDLLIKQKFVHVNFEFNQKHFSSRLNYEVHENSGHHFADSLVLRTSKLVAFGDNADHNQIVDSRYGSVFKSIPLPG